MNAPPPSRSPERGSTLIEAVIALSVLLVGLVGMAELQVWGMSSNQGATGQAYALELARELASGLQQLQYNDPLLTPTVTDPPPANFGKVIQTNGSFNWAAFTQWNDQDAAINGGPMGNVRLNAAIPTSKVTANQPGYQRSWSVWAPGGMAAQYCKVISVSVVYYERAFLQPNEVTLLIQDSSPVAAITDIGASR